GGRVRSRVSARGGYPCAVRGGISGAGGAGAGGELPGVWHTVGGGADAIAGCCSEVLGAGCSGVDAVGDRLRARRIGRGTAGLLSRQFALRPGDRAGGSIAVWIFARRYRWLATLGADDPMRFLSFRCLITVAALLLAGPAHAADRLPVVATFS